MLLSSYAFNRDSHSNGDWLSSSRHRLCKPGSWSYYTRGKSTNLPVHQHFSTITATRTHTVDATASEEVVIDKTATDQIVVPATVTSTKTIAATATSATTIYVTVSSTVTIPTTASAIDFVDTPATLTAAETATTTIVRPSPSPPLPPPQPPLTSSSKDVAETPTDYAYCSEPQVQSCTPQCGESYLFLLNDSAFANYEYFNTTYSDCASNCYYFSNLYFSYLLDGSGDCYVFVPNGPGTAATPEMDAGVNSGENTNYF